MEFQILLANMVGKVHTQENLEKLPEWAEKRPIFFKRSFGRTNRR